MATNMVTRKVRHKNADGTVIEADIGALAENVTEDANHRFVTDAEKEAWNNKPNTEDIDLSAKVDKQGGDIADTVVSTFEASTAEFPVPAAGEAPKTFMGKVKKFFEDFNNIRTGLLTLGQIVNNCTSDRSDLPLAAAQGKALRGQITELYNN
ncbi:MAG: hypothetical protein Q4C66_15240, partial [Lachnospiraceae bacterium]|nr:hypothetical protein [Lachnospiraceae bacterium]